MKYFVADSYKNYDRIGQPYDKNGKLYTKIRTSCPRCGGTGYYAIGVENGQLKLHPAYNGVCLQCDTKGYIEKEVRLYTDKEFEALEKATKKLADKINADREEKMHREYAEKRAKWLQSNGFGENETTYVYALPDSYDIKDQLKEAGFQFNNSLLWHAAVILEGYEDKIVEIPLNEVVEISAWGEGHYIEGAKQYVLDKIKEQFYEPSKSEWIGLEKEKITNLPVVLTSIRDIETRYGWTQLVTFMNGDNKIQWWTKVNIGYEIGEQLLMTATIKNHTTYKEEKITTVTRAKLVAAE